MRIEFNLVRPKSSNVAAHQTSPNMKASPKILGAETTAIGNDTFMLIDKFDKIYKPVEWNIHKLIFALRDMNRPHLIDVTGRLPNEKYNGVEILSIKMSSKNAIYDRYYGFSSCFWANAPFIDKKTHMTEEMKCLPNTKAEDSERHYNYQSREYIDKFVRFIQMMQEGNTLIYSNFDDLPKILNFNKHFNPQATKEALNMTPMHLGNLYQVSAYENLYKNLTDEDKEKMGWTEKFENDFIEFLKKERTYHINHK